MIRSVIPMRILQIGDPVAVAALYDSAPRERYMVATLRGTDSKAMVSSESSVQARSRMTRLLLRTEHAEPGAYELGLSFTESDEAAAAIDPVPIVVLSKAQYEEAIKEAARPAVQTPLLGDETELLAELRAFIAQRMLDLIDVTPLWDVGRFGPAGAFFANVSVDRRTEPRPEDNLVALDYVLWVAQFLLDEVAYLVVCGATRPSLHITVEEHRVELRASLDLPDNVMRELGDLTDRVIERLALANVLGDIPDYKSELATDSNRIELRAMLRHRVHEYAELA
jgi:hypothetical protein